MEDRDPRRARDSGEEPQRAATSELDSTQIGPSPARGGPRRGDSEIRADLDARLAGADEFDPNEVDLLVKDGIVVMLGQVPDQATKRRLEELAAEVPGVRELHDQLRVLGSGSDNTPSG